MPIKTGKLYKILRTKYWVEIDSPLEFFYELRFFLKVDAQVLIIVKNDGKLIIIFQPSVIGDAKYPVNHEYSWNLFINKYHHLAIEVISFFSRREF